MGNVSKIKRDKMIAFLEELKSSHMDDDSIKMFSEIENHIREKKYGLIWEEHTEEVDDLLLSNIPIFSEEKDKRIIKNENKPFNFILQGDNLQCLHLLNKTHKGKIDCIYIDPPYNTGAHDWKYNNDYVDETDSYRHSKWLSMMKRRLEIAKELLNPFDSVLICTIDEKEFLRVGNLLEELFPDANIQMISTVINSKGVARGAEFFRVNEYIFFVRIGSCGVTPLPLPDPWLGNIKTSTTKKVRWGSLMRSGQGSKREESPGCFYPIYVSKDKKRFCGAGEVVPVGVDRNTVIVPDDVIAVFPIHEDGTEGRWQYSREKYLEIQQKGYVRISTKTKSGVTLRYISEGWQKRVESGLIKIVGKNEDGSLILDDTQYIQSYIPCNQWWIPSHNATEFGSKMLTKIIGNRFPFPKSLYAVYDTLKFFLLNKPNATVLDFFAGSGTTLHAVCLLNAADGGNRKCILATNNEVAEDEAIELTKMGYKKGDPDWEKLGIARYVTWPRANCIINGIDISGNPLKGYYEQTYDSFEKDEDNKGLYVKNTLDLYPELKGIRLSDGFEENLKYFRCDWTPRSPEDYSLNNLLCLHIKEMIELEHHMQIDGKENVVILNKNDFKNTILNSEINKRIKNIWINQKIVFNAKELYELEKYEYRFIPKEYFGEELKEAAE